jgi:signal transduction histidine kinase
LAQQPPEIRLHFQFDVDGALHSPRVPPAAQREWAVGRLLDDGQIAEAEQLLDRLQNFTDAETLLARLPERETIELDRVWTEPLPLVETSPAQQTIPMSPHQQAARGAMEFQARSRSLSQSNTALVNNFLQSTSANALPPAGELERSNDSNEVRLQIADPDASGNPARLSADWLDAPSAWAVLMTPLWIDDELLLARRVKSNGRNVIQGCWLDWPAVKEQLLSEIADLLPAADLQPATHSVAEEQSRRLAALPVLLQPGELAETGGSGASPMRFALLLTWGGLLSAVLAVAGLLQGVVSLSERRAAFVSAVTHELRTPLTTFRMYAEMLAEGMVPDRAKRQQYLDTLRIEADRLTHLVENVLAYARLERGGATGRVQPVSVEDVLSVATQRLSGRAEQAGMQLLVEVDDALRTQTISADASAVEQILFNLVDNACKYAAAANDRRLHLDVVAAGKHLLFRLRDHGPGISLRDRRRLFHPFRKSAHAAAHSAPGVGLGLALSRRLARNMTGDLHYDPPEQGGARFTLRLPIVMTPA